MALERRAKLLTAGSRREALATVCTEEVDLALVGVTDPIEDALDLIQALIEIRPLTQLLLLVDRHLQRALSPLLASGISHTLSRTFDPQALIKMVDEILERRPGAAADEPVAGPDVVLPSAATAQRAAEPFEERCPPLRPLATELAHRLKNPLVSIATFSRLLKDRFEDASFRNDFHAMVDDEIRKLDETVDLLTMLASLPAPEPRACDVSALVAESLAAESVTLARKGITVRTKIVPGIPAVTVDPFYARTAISMALRMAARESPTGAQLSWSAAAGSRAGPEGSPMVELQLVYPGPASNTAIRGLESVLAEFALASFSGRIAIDSRLDGRKAIRLALLASSSDAGVPESEVLANLLLGRQVEFAFQNWVDRRTRADAIPFVDRRIEERRRSTPAILAKDRRRILGTFEEVIL